jgi:HEAT repeat protein
MLLAGDIDMGHARALLPLPGSSQVAFAQRIAAQGLSVREAERMSTALAIAGGQIGDKKAKSSKPEGLASQDADTRRLAQEMADLIASGLTVEVVPGITAGVAVSAYAGIPLTHRGYSSSVTFVTGHEAAGKYRPQVNWPAIAQGSETLVIYMGVHNLVHITQELKQAGKDPQTPVALIRWGTTPRQEELIATLDTIVALVEKTGFAAPAIAVIGEVVNLRSLLGF